ncbi:hypothetical protein BV20DRAFT_918936, partial [Pilatotrama ljubarskyi]
DDVLRYIAQEMDWRNKALQAMSVEMLKLKELQNSVVPINRLPAEILVEIFKHVRHSLGEIADIVNVSHVCKLWRSIALGAPELWTVFSINKLDVIAAFLQRSRARPI